MRDEDYDRAKLLKKEVSSLRKCVNEAVGHCDIDMHVEQQQLMPHLSSKNKVAQDLVRHSLSSEPQPIVVVPEKLEEQKELGMNNSDSHLGKKSGILKTPQSPQYTGGEEHRDQSSDVFEHIQVHTTPDIPILPPSTDSMPHFSGALSGLPNVAELPAPEAFAATDIVADADFSAISVFLGEYRACCLMSKNWALREAALAKTRLLVSEGCWGRSEDMAHLCSIARLGIQDKVAQVYLTALALLEDVIQKFSCQDFKSADMLTAMEPALDAIVSKLGDNQARLREKAVDALASPSYCRVIGARQIAAKVMNSLDKKRPPHNKWRPLATRLELLRRLAREYGLNRGVASENGLHALDLGSVIGFVEIHGCASHTFEEVRTAAKDLIVEMFIAASESDRLQALEPFLHKIRPRQAEEYRNALTRGLQNIVNNEITHESKPRYDVTISPPEASAADSISLKSQAVGHSSQSSVDVFTPPSQNIQEIQQTSTSLIFTFTSHDYLRVQHRLLRSEEEEELFRDQIMKQLEERAFSVIWICLNNVVKCRSPRCDCRFRKLMQS